MPFFPGVRCALELSNMQVALLEFIQLYENVEDMDPREKPAEDIVSDDAQFDTWIGEYTKKKEMEIVHGTKEGADKHQTVYKFEGNDANDFDQEGD